MLELARHGIIDDEGLWIQEGQSLVCCTAMRGFGLAVRGWGQEGETSNDVMCTVCEGAQFNPLNDAMWGAIWACCKG